MNAYTCKNGHAMLVSAPTATCVAYVHGSKCNSPLTKRSLTFAAAIKNGAPTR